MKWRNKNKPQPTVLYTERVIDSAFAAVTAAYVGEIAYTQLTDLDRSELLLCGSFLAVVLAAQIGAMDNLVPGAGQRLLQSQALTFKKLAAS